MYNRIGIVDYNKYEDDEDKIRTRYCVRCKDMFSVYALLGVELFHLTKIRVNQ